MDGLKGNLFQLHKTTTSVDKNSNPEKNQYHQQNVDALKKFLDGAYIEKLGVEESLINAIDQGLCPSTKSVRLIGLQLSVPGRKLILTNLIILEKSEVIAGEVSIFSGELTASTANATAIALTDESDSQPVHAKVYASAAGAVAIAVGWGTEAEATGHYAQVHARGQNTVAYASAPFSKAVADAVGGRAVARGEKAISIAATEHTVAWADGANTTAIGKTPKTDVIARVSNSTALGLVTGVNLSSDTHTTNTTVFDCTVYHVTTLAKKVEDEFQKGLDEQLSNKPITQQPPPFTQTITSVRTTTAQLVRSLSGLLSITTGRKKMIPTNAESAKLSSTTPTPAPTPNPTPTATPNISPLSERRTPSSSAEASPKSREKALSHKLVTRSTFSPRLPDPDQHNMNEFQSEEKESDSD